MDLGPLIARRRAELGQTLKEAAQELGICHQTLYKWEHGIRAPHIRLYPRIVAYLGYDPWDGASLSFGNRLRLARLRLGLSRERLAELLGISIDAYGRWEDDAISLPRPAIRRVLAAFLNHGLPVTNRQGEQG